jgi:DNA-binding NtrC family response regulator
MVSSKNYSPHETNSSGSLKGLHVLLVEDTWQVGEAIKDLLQILGAKVAGPAATTAEADRLLSEGIPDAALVDFCLRGGEQANGLIDRLNDRGVSVIVISGYEVLPAATAQTVAILKKPFTDNQLLAALEPLVAQKASR